MKPTLSKPITLRFVLLLLAMMLLVACKVVTPDETTDNTQAITPETIVQETQETMEEDHSNSLTGNAEPAVINVEESESVPAEETAPTTGKSTETITTEDGITMGFTKDGKPYLGNLDAPVVINEYSDYQCPFCAKFYREAMVDLRKKEIVEGDAVIIFNDFPLVSIHPQAMGASNAAHCAGEESVAYYWNMHDILFNNLGSWGVVNPTNLFHQYAIEAGVTDLASFDACVAENRYEDFLNTIIQEAMSNGVRATPTFIINGVTLSGAQPYNVFSSTVAQGVSGELKAPEPTPTLDLSDIEVEAPERLTLQDNAAGKLGDADAPITIIEYTDYQCPFCLKHKTETMPTLLAEYIETGRVNYELRDLPLESIHPLAKTAAIGGRCAGEQGSFWEMNDLLFNAQAVWGTSSDINASLIGYATELQLDVNAFGECLTNPEISQAVTDSIAEAQSIGITGTPFFIIDGFPLFNGAYPLEAFAEVIGMVEEDTLVDAMVDAQKQQVAQQRQQAAAQQQELTQFTEQAGVAVGLDGSYSIGAEDAPVVVVEYTDFQCPYCQRHAIQTFDSINAEFVESGLVRYVFKDFPLESIHPQARMASHAVRCAGDQEMYLEMHKAIFNGQQEWSGNNSAAEIFAVMAEQVGMDTSSFSECLASGQYDDEISADLAAAGKLGVRSTPTFMINGKLLAGAQPYAVFQQLINAEIELAEQQ